MRLAVPSFFKCRFTDRKKQVHVYQLSMVGSKIPTLAVGKAIHDHDRGAEEGATEK